MSRKADFLEQAVIRSPLRAFCLPHLRGLWRQVEHSIGIGIEIGFRNRSSTKPASAQYYAESATDNDYFIAGLTGPSYMYPKPIPETHFRPLMELARKQMDLLDLRDGKPLISYDYYLGVNRPEDEALPTLRN